MTENRIIAAVRRNWSVPPATTRTHTEADIEELEKLLREAGSEIAESRETIAMLAGQLADKREIIRKLTS